MKLAHQIFNFYINSSIHVALSCFALVNCTLLTFNIPTDFAFQGFVLFGTLVGYNFVKFDALARFQKNKMSNSLKGITFLSGISLLITVYYFFKLQNLTKISMLSLLLVTILYTLPFFPNNKNARNWAGFKIYIVTICWVVITLIVPFINSEIAVPPYFILWIIHRFLFVLLLILIFEIIDLKKDDPHLKTIPQQIGVNKTKILGFILLLFFCGISFFIGNDTIPIVDFQLNFVIAVILALFLYFANENRSKFYTSFWVEGIPIFWWLTLLLTQ